jgi:beta-lactamase regulating signal transducer with metallopeptidase domain
MWLVSAVWVIGSLALGVSRWIRWRRLTIAARASASLHSGREATSLERARARFRSVDHVDLRSSPSFLEPGVIGFIRPMILWPAALTARLTDAELDAVWRTSSHIRRRDNLVAAAHR